jgi:hypothetical membrane protein
VAESTYANYSVSQNFLSDLGATCHSGAGTSACFIVQPSSIIFNSALFLLGLLSIASAYLIYRALGRRLFPTLFGLFGVGTLLAGVFPETFIMVHELASLLAFVCGGIAVLSSVSLGLEMPKFFRYVSVLLGVLALAALIPVVFSGPFMRLNNDFGIGPGGTERIVAYPIVTAEVHHSLPDGHHSQPGLESNAFKAFSIALGFSFSISIFIFLSSSGGI